MADIVYLTALCSLAALAIADIFPVFQWLKQKAFDSDQWAEGNWLQRNVNFLLNCPECQSFWIGTAAGVFAHGWHGIVIGVLAYTLTNVINDIRHR